MLLWRELIFDQQGLYCESKISSSLFRFLLVGERESQGEEGRNGGRGGAPPHTTNFFSCLYPRSPTRLPLAWKDTEKTAKQARFKLRPHQNDKSCYVHGLSVYRHITELAQWAMSSWPNLSSVFSGSVSSSETKSVSHNSSWIQSYLNNYATSIRQTGNMITWFESDTEISALALNTITIKVSTLPFHLTEWWKRSLW